MSAAITASVIGIGGSIGGALASADAQTSANNKANDQIGYARVYAENERNRAQNNAYAMANPYLKLGYSAAPYLQSAVLGSPVEYRDPNFTLATASDIASAINNMGQKLDSNQVYFRDPETGALVTENNVPQLTANFQMQESPAAKWQKQQATQAMNRNLASRGLSGSGNAVNRLTDLASSVAANDWNNQYQRLMDLTKIGSGQANTTSNQQLTTSAGNASAYAPAATQQAGLTSTNGQIAGSLYSGLGSFLNSSGTQSAMTKGLQSLGSIF